MSDEKSKSEPIQPEHVLEPTPVIVCSGTNYVSCRTCPAVFPPPKLKDGYNDVAGECPLCNRTYIFWWKAGTEP